MSSVSLCSERNTSLHQALETSIQTVQSRRDRLTLSLTETSIQRTIQALASQNVYPQLLACSQLCNLLAKDSLTDTALLILQDKEKRGPSSQDALQKLKQTNIGQELLLRVTHAISAIVSKLPPVFSHHNLEDIHHSTELFASQSLLQHIREVAIRQEDELAQAAHTLHAIQEALNKEEELIAASRALGSSPNTTDSQQSVS